MLANAIIRGSSYRWLLILVLLTPGLVISGQRKYLSDSTVVSEDGENLNPKNYKFPLPINKIKALENVAFSPDGNYLASASSFNQIRVWAVSVDNPPSLRLIKVIDGDKLQIDVRFDRFWDLIFSRDNRRIICTGRIEAGSRNTSKSNMSCIQVWDVESGEMIKHRTFGFDGRPIFISNDESVAFCPYERLFSMKNPQIYFVNTETFEVTQTIDLKKIILKSGKDINDVRDYALSPNGRYFVFNTYERVGFNRRNSPQFWPFSIWDIRQDKLLYSKKIFVDNSGPLSTRATMLWLGNSSKLLLHVESFKLLPNENIKYESRIITVDAITGEEKPSTIILPIIKFKENLVVRYGFSSVDVSPDGNFLAISGKRYWGMSGEGGNGMILIFNLVKYEMVDEDIVPGLFYIPSAELYAKVSRLRYSPKGNLVAGTYDEGVIIVWRFGLQEIN